MKNCILFILLMLGFNYAFSIPVDTITAKKVATDFFLSRISQSNQPILKSLSTQQIELQLAHREFGNSGVAMAPNSNEPYYYIYNVKGDNGFIIISADDDVVPILGYAFKGRFENTNPPPAFVEWMNNYKKQIHNVKINKIKGSSSIVSEWTKSSQNGMLKSTTVVAEVLPLLSTTWNQGADYNLLCPSDTRSTAGNGHVWAGCVASAQAQIMKYWNYPTHGTGSHTDIDPINLDDLNNQISGSNYGSFTANFGATTYNWANMSNSFANNDVATLYYHIGISVDMNYGPYGSGAGDSRYSLVNYFNYSSTAQYVYKSNYPADTDWENLIKGELDQSRPVWYRGDGTGGHAFVCDGYQGTNYFHFNWGWGGAYDNYFYLNNLNPAGDNFTNNQGAIVGVKPNLADLIPLSQSLSTTSIQAGSSLTAYCAENNNGPLAAGANVVSIHLSTDNVLTPGTNGDRYIDEISISSAPANSSSTIYSKLITIPADVPPGNYYVFFSADGGQAISEIFENNNFVSSPIIVTGGCTGPTIQATAFTSSALTDKTITASWIRGNGSAVIVVAHQGSIVNSYPTSGVSYIANSAFGSGSQIGTGNYVVYNGTGTSVTLTALAASTTYYYSVYEYSSGTICYKTPSLDGNATTTGSGGTVTDIDGNIYSTVTIGNQVWLGSNLKVTRYNDNTIIPLVTDNTAWINLNTPGYCWFTNDVTTYKNPYGALYNWYTVNTNKLCPIGWHVPSDVEWSTLSNFLGGETIAGGALKETGTIHWRSPNTGATNSSSFTAIPGGFRSSFDGTFSNCNVSGSYWSSTEYSTTFAWPRDVSYLTNTLYRYTNVSKNVGASIRCISNGITQPSVTTTPITGKTTSAVMSGGNVSFDGGGAITARGVCWNTISSPTIANSKTTDGSGTGSFTSSITGLNPNTTYYVRAYASNSAGPGYGDNISFTTLPAAPTIGQITHPTCTLATGSVSLSGLPSTGSWTLTRSPGTVTTTGTGSTVTIAGLAAGTYTYTVTNGSGGVSASSANIVINSQPVGPTISGSLTACVGSTIQLTGSGTAATSTPWLSGTTTVATVTSTGLVTGVAAGTSLITYTNNGGCKTTATVTVSALPAITGTLTTCIGSTTLLTGSGTSASTTPWVSASTGVATVSNSGLVTGVAAGTSVITFTNSGGCKKTAIITVYALPTAPAAIGGTKTVCVGSTTTLTETSTGGTWSSSTPALATVSTSGVVTGITTGTATIVYTTAANANGCKNSSSTTVTVNAPPTITGTFAVCIGSTTQLAGSGTAAATSPWLSATTTVATVSTTGLVTGVSAGTSVITFTNSSGCKITTIVTVSALPTISGTLTICAGSTTQLTGTGTAAASSPWVSTSTAVATVNNTGLVTGVAAGTSVITFTNNGGCKKTVSVTVSSRPVAPVVAAATTITATGFTAKWAASTGATGYYLDVSTSSTFASFVTGYSSKSVGNVVTSAVTGLTTNTTYYYRVRAFNASCTSVSSSTISTTTSVAAPTAPVSAAATNITSTGFSAKWTASTGATGYYLDVSKSSTFASFVTGYSSKSVGNVVTSAVTGLTANTTYYYRVRAYNTAGTSGNSNTITVKTAPAAPVATAATTIAQTTFSAKWNASTGATGYYLDVSKVNTFASFVTGYNNKSVGNVVTSSVTGLTASTIYYYRVRAFNTGGTSGGSNTITVTSLKSALIATDSLQGSVNTPVRIIDLPALKNELKVYPNPTTSSATFEFQINENAKVRLDIYSLGGQHIDRIFEGDAVAGISQTVKFDQSLPTGIYPCVMRWKEKIITVKLVIKQ